MRVHNAISARRDAGAAEVIGGFLMLTISLSVFLLLASAMLDQARDTANYIRSLTPDGEGLDPAANATGPPANGTQPNGTQPNGTGQQGARPPACIPFPGATWCEEPGNADPDPLQVCVRDSRGIWWCQQVPPQTPPGPPPPGP